MTLITEQQHESEVNWINLADIVTYLNSVPCLLFFSEEGIEPLLELEDVMAVDVPEPKSLITYVHFIYQHFAGKQQQQKQV